MKEERGITLIALVITIIVLIILAGITISTLTGDNGILHKVEEAKTQTDSQEEKENIAIGYNEYKIKKYTDTDPKLTVEGAVVTGSEKEGWTVLFEKTKRSYNLSYDGTIQIANKKIYLLDKSNNTLMDKIVYEGIEFEFENLKINNGVMEISIVNSTDFSSLNLEISKYQDIDCVNLRSINGYRRVFTWIFCKF